MVIQEPFQLYSNMCDLRKTTLVNWAVNKSLRIVVRHWKSLKDHFIHFICGVTQDMAPPQPQRTDGCLASSHKEQGKQSVSGCPSPVKASMSQDSCVYHKSTEFSHVAPTPSTATTSSL